MIDLSPPTSTRWNAASGRVFGTRANPSRGRVPPLAITRLLFTILIVACMPAALPAQSSDFPGAESYVYQDTKPEAMKLHVFKPKGWTTSDRRPVLLHFFGGGFVRGTAAQSTGWAKQAAKLGMVGVAADYRVFTRHGTNATACLADARAAVHWLQTHAAELGLDPQQVVVSGSSAGGLLALWTAISATPPGSDPAKAPLAKPVALILMWPAADLLLFQRKLDPFAGHARECSGTQNLDAQMPPTLLLHGDADPTVPYRTSVELHRKLTETGNLCEFITMPGCSHGTTLPEWKEKLPGLIQKFLTDQKILPIGGAR